MNNIKDKQHSLQEMALNAANHDPAILPVVYKEIIHYDIMSALYRSDMSDKIVFQGGTSLRLCYGGNRYSEDLDFCCRQERDFDAKNMEAFSAIMIDSIKERYGLDCQVKAPKKYGFGNEGVEVLRWQVNVTVPNPDKSVPQKQKIKVEVASVPSHDSHVIPLQENYHGVVAQHGAILSRTSTLRELYADKMLAMAFRNKNRDIWDLNWLSSLPDLRKQGVNVGLLKKKIIDYKGDLPNYLESLSARQEGLKDGKAGYIKEMSRFVDADNREVALSPEYIDATFDKMQTLINKVKSELNEPAVSLEL